MFLKVLFLSLYSFFFILFLLARSYRSAAFYIISLLMRLLSLQAPLTLIFIQASLRYLNASLSSIWFSNNHLMLNPNKSEVMFVGSPILLSKSNLPTEVIFDGTTFSVTSKLKILGVTLDSRLNFTHFVSRIIQASNFHFHAIRQARKFLPFDTAVALIISLVLSRIDYCNSLLCRLPNCLISKLHSSKSC